MHTLKVQGTKDVRNLTSVCLSEEEEDSCMSYSMLRSNASQMPAIHWIGNTARDKRRMRK
jgi:hypothetical protein